jgi:hemoglobin
MSESTPTLICKLAVRNLVTAFYVRVRRDHLLAPIFAHAVGTTDAEWTAHIALLEDFWTSMFLGGSHRRPKPADAYLPNLEPALFERWLALLHGTCADLFEPYIAAAFQDGVGRIAAVLSPIGVGNQNPLNGGIRRDDQAVDRKIELHTSLANRSDRRTRMLSDVR